MFSVSSNSSKITMLVRLQKNLLTNSCCAPMASAQNTTAREHGRIVEVTYFHRLWLEVVRVEAGAATKDTDPVIGRRRAALRGTDVKTLLRPECDAIWALSSDLPAFGNLARADDKRPPKPIGPNGACRIASRHTSRIPQSGHAAGPMVRSPCVHRRFLVEHCSYS